MRVADQVFDILARLGSRYAAGVAGGGIMFLVDALKKNKEFKLEFFHHEQSAAFAAEAYARCTQTLPVCFATIGPGVANALSGAFSCFINSVPCFFVTGSKRSNIATDYKTERFVFPQDCDTEALVKGAVKRFHELKVEDNIEVVVQELFNEAMGGRPGPVWLSIPLDVQSMEFKQSSNSAGINGIHPIADKKIDYIVENIIESLRTESADASRPIIILGHGVERVCSKNSFRKFLSECGLPVVTSVGGNHFIVAAGDLAVGIFGPTGRRAANEILVESDLIIGLGFRFTPDTIGFNTEAFFGLKKVLAITDDPSFYLPASVSGVVITIPPEKIPFQGMLGLLKSQATKYVRWINYVKTVKTVLTDEREIKANLCRSKVDPYLFGHALLAKAAKKTGIAGGISLEIVALSNSLNFRDGHEFYISSHAGQLGWDLPATVGLAHSGRFRSVVCFTGDGSIMFNLQELATLSRVTCGVTVFVVDNEGYNSIRSTQETHLDSNYSGSTLQDLSFPDWSYLAKAFGFSYARIDHNEHIDKFFSKWDQESKTFVQVTVDSSRGRTPKLVSSIKNGKFESPPINQQYPPLPQELVDAISRARFQRDNP